MTRRRNLVMDYVVCALILIGYATWPAIGIAIAWRAL